MATWLPDDPSADRQIDFLLFLQCKSKDASEDTFRLRLHAAALVDDILMSKLHVHADLSAHDTVQTPVVCPAGRALSASRALQVAFAGFADAAVGAPTIAVLLAEKNDTVDRAKFFATAKPFQVLITQSLHGGSAFPKAYAAQGLPGVYEFFWTDVQRLQELQGKHAFRPLAVPSALGQNTVVTEFNDSPTRVFDDRPTQLFDDRATQLFTRDDSLVEPFPLPAASRNIGEIRERRDDGDVSDPEDPQQRGKGVRVALIAAILIVVAILGYLGSNYTEFGSQWKGQIARQLGLTQAPPPPPPPPDPQRATVYPPVANGQTPPPTGDVLPRPQPAVKPAPTVPSPPHSPCPVERSEISDKLALANEYMKTDKNGYKQALRIYSQLRNCDPVRSAAKAGLQQAQQALDDNP